MARTAYKECLGQDLVSGENVRIVGKLKQQGDNIILDDNTAVVTIINPPQAMNSFVEIRGKVNGANEIECFEHVIFADEEFDMKDYAELLGIYKRFPELTS